MTGSHCFLTGIIVITCIFLPFNWSIQNSGNWKRSFSILFQINIEGSNFISILPKCSGSQWSCTNYPALLSRERYRERHHRFVLSIFLEELAKLTLLILCIRKESPDTCYHRLPHTRLFTFSQAWWGSILLSLWGYGYRQFDWLLILWTSSGTLFVQKVSQIISTVSPSWHSVLPLQKISNTWLIYQTMAEI